MVLAALELGATEGDVETQIVLPILSRAEYLDIEGSWIKSKEFLAAFDIGKGAKLRKGYIPDYCIYVFALPTLVVEVKAPTVPVGNAWDEASLYAHALNKRYPAKINPCELILATNGLEIMAGRWDSASPVLSGLVKDLVIGSVLLDRLQTLLSRAELERLGKVASTFLRSTGFRRPASLGEGPALIVSKLDPNTFAADLSPVLRKYFSSRDQNADPEIYQRAYVSTNEITSYDKVLESFLIDRLSRSTSRTEVATTKKSAQEVSRKLAQLASQRSPSGELQLITGGVGTGKSLFARRYKEYLQPKELRDNSHWAFVDFNFAPEQLATASSWVCAGFVQSVIQEGAPIDLRRADHQERIFASELADRGAFYQRVDAALPGRGLLEQARDIEAWRQDPVKSATGISRYLQGDRGQVVIVVFDNVDQRDVNNQLAAFQLALWFMDQTRCLVILQMRDTTFEAHKNSPPLDTYKTGQVFHISPPRFIDIVKRRLELSLIQLEAEVPETIRYQAPSGVTISYSRDKAGVFLNSVYLELFQRPTNVSRILEALAGRNVRKALDMFLAIINSGHMPEDLITAVATGSQVRKFSEALILRILMRQDYRFFSEASGFVSNILYCDRNWQRPSNFLVVELLFYLISERKTNGDNGQLGFVSANRARDRLEQLGYVGSDVLNAANHLLAKELIEADSATTMILSDATSIKATASGWAHLRILASRSEYLVSLLPNTAIDDRELEARIFDLMLSENRFGRLRVSQSSALLENLQEYLQKQFDDLRRHPGYAQSEVNGGLYLLGKVREAISFTNTSQGQVATQVDWLDR